MEQGMQVLIIKPATDSKGGNKVVSRLGVSKQVDLMIRIDDNLFEKIQEWQEKNGPLDCLLVDEVQFFLKSHIDQLFEVAVKLNVPTICYGLRTDFKMNGFEGSERLLLLAHSIEELKTICTCGKKAMLNGRKIYGRFVFEGEQIAIDQENNVEYQSLCPRCYYKYQEEAKQRNMGF